MQLKTYFLRVKKFIVMQLFNWLLNLLPLHFKRTFDFTFVDLRVHSFNKKCHNCLTIFLFQKWCQIFSMKNSITSEALANRSSFPFVVTKCFPCAVNSRMLPYALSTNNSNFAGQILMLSSPERVKYK